MKHTLKITIILILIFFFSQLIGLTVINKDINVVKTPEGKIEVQHPETAIGPRPEMKPNVSFWYIIGAVLIGTLIVLILVKFRKFNIWKVWFFFAVWLAMTIAIGVFVDRTVAYVLCFLLALWKIYRPNIYVHNLTEIFMYTGIALIFVPLLNVFWAIMLLVAISTYDIYAVWKSKHMIKMAEFQAESNVFAGLFLPYKRKKVGRKEKTKIEKIKPIKISKVQKKEKETNVAILGGGDIAFPLIFSGVVMESLIKFDMLSKLNAFLFTLIITFFVTLALILLFYKSEKGKYYPAMPFLTTGCLVGYGIVYLLQMIIL